jgi:hypothetical protein
MNEVNYIGILNFSNIVNDKFGFEIRKIIDNNTKIDESSMGIDKISLMLGQQTIYRAVFDSSYSKKLSGTFYTSTSDGDITADTYGIIEVDSLNNFINITEEQNNYHEIRGVFSMSLVRTRKSQYTLFPNLDTVRFKNCSFHFFLK